MKCHGRPPGMSKNVSLEILERDFFAREYTEQLVQFRNLKETSDFVGQLGQDKSPPFDPQLLEKLNKGCQPRAVNIADASHVDQNFGGFDLFEPFLECGRRREINLTLQFHNQYPPFFNGLDIHNAPSRFPFPRSALTSAPLSTAVAFVNLGHFNTIAFRIELHSIHEMLDEINAASGGGFQIIIFGGVLETAGIETIALIFNG